MPADSEHISSQMTAEPDLLGDARLAKKKPRQRVDAAALSRANLDKAVRGEVAPPPPGAPQPAAKPATGPAAGRPAATPHYDEVLGDPRLADDLLTLKLLAADPTTHPDLDAKLRALDFKKLGTRLRIREALCAMPEEELVPLPELKAKGPAGPARPKAPASKAPALRDVWTPPEGAPGTEPELAPASKGFKYIDSKDPNIDWANSDFCLEVEALAQSMPRREPPPPPQYKWWIVKAERVAVRPTPGRHGAPLSAFRKGSVIRVAKVEEHGDAQGACPWARLEDSELPFLYCGKEHVPEAWMLVSDPRLGDLLEPVPLEALDTVPQAERDELERDLFDPTIGPRERAEKAATKAATILEKHQAEAAAAAEVKAAQDKEDSVMAKKDWQVYFGQEQPDSKREPEPEPERPKLPPLRPPQRPKVDKIGHPIVDDSSDESDPGMDVDVDTPGANAKTLAKAHRKWSGKGKGGGGGGGGGGGEEHVIKQRGARTKDEQFEADEDDEATGGSGRKPKDKVSMPTTISGSATSYARPAGPPKPPSMPMLPPMPSSSMMPVSPESQQAEADKVHAAARARAAKQGPQVAARPQAPHIPIALTPQQEELQRQQRLEEAREQLRKMTKDSDEMPEIKLKEVKF